MYLVNLTTVCGKCVKTLIKFNDKVVAEQYVAQFAFKSEITRLVVVPA